MTSDLSIKAVRRSSMSASSSPSSSPPQSNSSPHSPLSIHPQRPQGGRAEPAPLPKADRSSSRESPAKSGGVPGGRDRLSAGENDLPAVSRPVPDSARASGPPPVP